MLGLETVLLLAAFSMLIWCFVRKNRMGGIQWYPKAVRQWAVEKGLIEESYIRQRKKISSMVMILMVGAIVLGAVFLVNDVKDWKTAFYQIYFMMFVLNLFDAVVVDYIWVRKSDYWKIPEFSELEIAKPVRGLVKERMLAAIVYIPLSALFACIVFFR